MSRSRTRPSRTETRERLFAAAATVFVNSGIGAASIEEICLEAGLTRGALYSNFANKDELVMAMIDDHSQRNLAELSRLAAVASSPQEYLELIDSPSRRRDGAIGADSVLYMEFILYAVRNPVNRPRIAEHHMRLVEFTAEIARNDSESLGIDPVLPPEEIGALILAIDNGYLLNALIEPGSYAPGTFSRTLLALRSLWAAASTAPATQPPARPSPDRPTPARPSAGSSP